MKRSPSSFSSSAPSPRSASDSRNRGAPGTSSAVGWNCTNSRSVTRAPANHASITPSPVAIDGLVVSRNTWPAPPVASNTAPACTSSTPIADGESRADAAPVTHDQLVDARIALDAHACLLGDALPQRAANLPAGRIRGVQHAPPAVRAFAAERQRADRIAIEPRAPLDQLVHIAHAVFDQHRRPRPRRTGHRPR